MKVFKFYSDKYFYTYYANSKDEARKCLFDQMGEMIIDKVEEIPESQWDEKNITFWVDNDGNDEYFKESIRDIICGDEPQMILTDHDYLKF